MTLLASKTAIVLLLNSNHSFDLLSADNGGVSMIMISYLARSSLNLLLDKILITKLKQGNIAAAVAKYVSSVALVIIWVAF
jgi:hypothetical protein